jgi:hypothetical protein
VLVALIAGFALGGLVFQKSIASTITSTQVETSLQTLVSLNPVTTTLLLFNSTATVTQTVNLQSTTTEFEAAGSADSSEILQLENEIHLYDIQYLIQNEQVYVPAGGNWSSTPLYSNETGYIVVGVSASTSSHTLVNCFWSDNFVNNEALAYNETVDLGSNGVAHFPFVGFAPGSSGPNSIQIHLLSRENSPMSADLNVILVY